FRPLELRKRLRDKEGRTECHLAFSVSLILRNLVVLSSHPIRQSWDLFHILFCLTRKSEHKVEFDFIPASFKGFGSAVQNHLFGQSFVNDIPHPLGSGFRRKGQTALLDVLYLSHHIQRE